MPSQGLQQVQRLGLQQTLSPQMQQSLHILQIPSLELSTLIRQELTSNPVLEEGAGETESENEELQVDPMDPEAPVTDAKDEEANKEIDQLVQLDQEWRDYFNQTNAPIRQSAEEEKQWKTFFESVAKTETLQEHLLAQLHVAEVDETLRALCETMIGNIDDRGFLVATDEDLKTWSKNQPDLADSALETIQSFDPIGVGSRNLRECLLIQLQRLGHSENSLPTRVVSEHLDDLAAKKNAEISTSLKVSLEEVHKAAALISTLNPQPGSRFTTDENRYITPDLVIQKIGDEWVVMMNNDWLPSIRISNTYKDILGQSGQGSEVKSYVRERLRAAKFFIKSIDQRQQTIMKIAHEILRVQADFFNLGREYLKPLTMTEVAQWIKVHETTVSRAIANKYIQTPHGIFELKYFFTPGIRLDGGGSMTSDEIKNAISELVSNEPADKPLTDQDLMAELKKKNIPIARRTVAKYREELKILPSHSRRTK